MWIIENWYLIVCVGVAAVIIGFVIGRFLRLPKATQIATIKEWLLYACIEAERQFSSGTGQIKLRFVYDRFLSKFPTVAQMISFETFSMWVDGSLLRMKEMLSADRAVRTFVEGEVE